MTKENLTASSRSRPLRARDPGRYAFDAAWLEAKAQRGSTVTISAAFAREIALVLRQLVHAERAA